MFILAVNSQRKGEPNHETKANDLAILLID
jgi:hypothetical protein